MIVDAHCHAWERWPYQPPVPDFEQRGRVEQLLWEMDRNGVDRAVVICAGIDHNPDNNAYVAACAAAHPDRLVQFADVDSRWTPTYHAPGAADRLAAVLERWPLKGFTHYVEREPDGWFASDEGVRLFSLAAERGLIASIAAPPAWQPALRELARRFPTMPILCHHLAGVRAGDPEGLREVLRSASVPSIAIKVSGFYYASATDWDFPFSDVHHIVRALYEHFGPRRLCWGSDYPVVRRATTYRQALEAVRAHCPFIPAPDMEWVLGGNLNTLLT